MEREAFDESDFQQTEYWIYDKTLDDDDTCNRLIVVEPFEWYLLNVNRQLYLIDPERPIGALRILSDHLLG
ncbi:uncharacterized protein LOC112595713 [Melanaphis sacchari]|uniref:uncharacterized protein LOC112595713 n=1 Tax=Melanaphis sacchari TaxID=742174 RepID=UPI000DC14653|nr:uncharacterized protein LOC112595713 [Melanaphis sacchari]